MENLRVLDRAGGADRRALRLADPGGDGALSGVRPPAAALPAGDRVSHRVGGPVRPDGRGRARVWLAPPSPGRTAALRWFGAQLAFNFFRSILFFKFQAYGPALFWLIALWCLILGMLLAFRTVDRTAGRLQIPDLLWAAFAAYLDLGVWLLDRQPPP